MWLRDAISGTTPPWGAWSAIWVCITDDRTWVPSLTTAAALSSQDDSIPSISIFFPIFWSLKFEV